MCRRVECSTCGKPTYAGCGQHVEQVIGDVPPAERCRCREGGAQVGGSGGGSAGAWGSQSGGRSRGS